MKGLKARRRDRLLELDEVERRLKPFGRRYLGVRDIPLDALVGTDRVPARSPATSGPFTPSAAALARRGGRRGSTELIARVPLPAGADMLEVVLRELERTAGSPRHTPACASR